MEFTNKIKVFSEKINSLKDNLQTEEATKMSLIMPFFQLLGYDVFNPNEFCPEFTADVGTKKGEKVDYAILINNEPQILVECKPCKEELGKHGSQLFRYFTTSKAKFGILTNGIIYRFYTDLDETNKMDLTPFLEIDMLNLRDPLINELKKFTKENFNADAISSTASDLKYMSLFKDVLSKEFEEPSDDFIKLLLNDVYTAPKTQKVIDRFKPIIKRSTKSFINEVINDRLTTALNTNNKITEEDIEDESSEPTSKIITTESEMQGFYIVCSILSELVPISDITYKDTESYFGILYKKNTRKPICRLNFDTAKMQVMIPDENKKFTRHYLDSITDLYIHKDELIKALKIYL